MKRTSVFIAIIAGTTVATPVSAADALTVAANTGSQVGKATYCGFETEEFATRAGRAIDHYAQTSDERSSAIKQFMAAARMGAQTGPIGESCSEFRESYLESLQIIKNAGF